MWPRYSGIVLALLAGAFLFPAASLATDVDGPDDCQREYEDMGDAPEAAQAYPGVPGAFPTCLVASAPGTQELACIARSTPPGATGFVRHTVNWPDGRSFWLGCSTAGPPLGVDGEFDGKMNDNGGAISSCNDNLQIDCVEAAFGLNFGQDECYGSDDAGIGTPVAFQPCTMASVQFYTYNCFDEPQTVRLNILVDWNQDGDWNDNFECPDGTCTYEWAVKNFPLVIPPGCTLRSSPMFLTGPQEAEGWMRISISRETVTDDFPWAGVSLIAAQTLVDGETEDYPVTIRVEDECPEYSDYGDAPEEVDAYPGTIGHFPTCIFPSTPGTQEHNCPGAPLSTTPRPTGWVEHKRVLGDPDAFWLGCGDASVPHPGVDGEPNGKMNADGGPQSVCDDTLKVDCVEPAPWGMQFGQDECYGDEDAGIVAPIIFQACSLSTVTFEAYNCRDVDRPVYLNILVDWNEDGDWNDSFLCDAEGPCAYEWAVKNTLITLSPGCQTMTSPSFIAGPDPGDGWLRITLTPDPVLDGFPWAGSTGEPDTLYWGGETEDYPVTIEESETCELDYEDFGDAPEEVDAYSGVIGNFPTCLLDSGPGTQEIECGTAQSTAPGQTGFVRHAGWADDPYHFWLGCAAGGPITAGIDSEFDGKMNNDGSIQSACTPNVSVDCIEPAWGFNFGQDECYGTLDAGIIGGFVQFPRCSLAVVPFQAFLCESGEEDVYLNILVDWNEDGDWNDNILCPAVGYCAPEWAVKNYVLTLNSGCNSYVSPAFRVGPKLGEAWMRITISRDRARDDFPWAGTATMPGEQALRGGETEDYPVRIVPSLVDAPTLPPTGLWLSPPIPNPSPLTTTVRFAVPSEQFISLDVFDLAGRRVRTLEQQTFTVGEYTITWDFRSDSGVLLPAGMYIIRFAAGDQSFTQRVVHIR